MPESTATGGELDHALATVRDRITKYQRQGIGEQDTKAALIVPVLRALGWDLEDLEDVKLEYRRRPSDNPVDYALFSSARRACSSRPNRSAPISMMASGRARSWPMPRSPGSNGWP